MLFTLHRHTQPGSRHVSCQAAWSKLWYPETTSISNLSLQLGFFSLLDWVRVYLNFSSDLQSSYWSQILHQVLPSNTRTPKEQSNRKPGTSSRFDEILRRVCFHSGAILFKQTFSPFLVSILFSKLLLPVFPPYNHCRSWKCLGGHLYVCWGVHVCVYWRYMWGVGSLKPYLSSET